MLKKTLLASCLSVTMLANVYAVQLGKPISVTIDVPHKGLQGPVTQKEIVLMNILLTPEQQRILNSYNPKESSLALINKDSSLPSQVQLGMGSVPVLDQGRHGTCVTFATSAAIDATIDKGDYVSQLCSLELGKVLQENGYEPSGWDGSWGYIVTDQYLRFGAVSMKDQREQGCAGVKEYPRDAESNTGVAMKLREYKSLSEDLNYYFYVNPLMNFDQRLSKDVNNEKIEFVVKEIKEALHSGNRVTFGTILIIPPRDKCTVGACATHNATNDTWALTSELDLPNNGQGGHEMVITGYDDNATAIDHDGKTHKGLFTLRNSWGANVGDKGNFYMTYDYFKKFAGEAQVIAKR